MTLDKTVKVVSSAAVLSAAAWGFGGAAADQYIDNRIDMKLAGVVSQVEELEQKVSTEGSKTRIEVYGVQNELTKVQADLEHQGKDIDRAVETLDKLYQHLIK